MSIYTLSPERPLLELLAQQAKPGTLVLLPNRRSSQALEKITEKIVICPLGDLSASLLSKRDPALAEQLEAIAPAISSTHRLMAITRELWQEREGLGLVIHSIDQAARLAMQLTAQMDELDREGVEYHRLRESASAGFSEHGQRSLELLNHLLSWWPGYLTELGMMNPLARRNRILEVVASYWRSNVPHYSIIAAGSTGSQPATATLLSVISHLPSGMVWLQGLDNRPHERCWDAIQPSHPQYPFRGLLTLLRLKPWDVPDWAEKPSDGTFQEWLDACLPAELTPEWMARPIIGEPIRRIDCAHEREEADMAAWLLQEACASGKISALITPDANLIRRVQAQLAAVGVAAHSAVGTSGALAPTAQFLSLIMEALTQPDQVVSLLAMLKHPLCRITDDEMLWDATLYQIELRIARGLRRRVSWLVLLQALAEADDVEEDQRMLIKILTDILVLACDLFAKRVVEVEVLSAALQGLADTLSHGQALAHENWPLAQEAMENLLLLGAIEPGHYRGLFIQATEQQKYFDTQDATIHLLTPLEARLLHYDRVILAGLNEGCWPRSHSEHYSVSTAMREQLGLPPADAAIGLQAHDFIMNACADDVIFLRARRSGGADTSPSRWLVRYDAMRGEERNDDLLDECLFKMREASKIEALSPSPRPAPSPPLAIRPTRLSVSDVELWLRDPYALYAKHVLKLKKLEPIDQSPDAALRGSIIHQIWERFVHMVNRDAEALNLAGFERCAMEVLREYSDWPLVTLFWSTRIRQMGTWIVALEQERRAQMQTITPEQKVQGKFGQLEIYGRIDRLEWNAGAASIIDYKTGQAPGPKDVALGYGCQLPLLALMLTQQKGLTVSELAYWMLGSGTKPPEMKLLKDVEALLEIYRDGIERLTTRYLVDGQPYYAIPNPAHAPGFNDYAHLERVEEWA
jgi:ATP-dependent helicase/nuclease subunit B